jgi:hypothetical protein
LLLAAFLIAWHVRNRTPRADWAFACVWVVLPVVTSALIASGRARFPLEQALSSRYVTFSNLLWLGVTALFVAHWVARNDARNDARSGMQTRAARVADVASDVQRRLRRRS